MQSSETESRAFGGGKELMQIAWPLIISSGSFAVLHFCDRLYLSWYSEEAFRACVPAGILFFTLVCGFMALAGFTNTFVAQYWGAGDRQGCARATAQGIFFSLLSWPLIMAQLPLGVWLLRISGHDPAVLALEERYLGILMWAGAGMTMSSALGSFYSGRGNTRILMVCNIIANLVNIVLDYALVFGRWGFPEWGIDGAAWATVAGAWTSPVILGALYFSGAANAEFQTRRNLRFDRWLFMRMIRFGVPSGVHWFLDVSSFTIFVLLVGRMGAVAHVASNIALSVNLIAFMPMVGMGTAASILVGQYLGRTQPGHAERMGWLATRIAAAYTLVVAVTFVLFPGFYISVFEGHAAGAVPFDELLKMVRILMVMLAVWGMMDAASIIISGALNGAGDTHFVMYYHTVLSWGFLVPGQLAIVFLFKGGVYASWAWTLLYIVVLGAGYILRFRSGRWKQIDLLDRRPAVPAVPVPPGP